MSVVLWALMFIHLLQSPAKNKHISGSDRSPLTSQGKHPNILKQTETNRTNVARVSNYRWQASFEYTKSD